MKKGYCIVFGPADVGHDMKDFKTWYQDIPEVTEAYDYVSSLIGIPTQLMFDVRNPTWDISLMQKMSISLATGMFGLAKRVIEEKGEPEFVAGVSLGELVACCVCNSIRLKDLIRLLLDNDDYAANQNEQIAFVYAPKDSLSSRGILPENLYVAVDYGCVKPNYDRLMMVVGLEDSMRAWAEKEDYPVMLLPREMAQSAYHSPLRRHVMTKIGRDISDMHISGPQSTILSCVAGLNEVNTGRSVDELLTRSFTETLHVPQLLSNISKAGINSITCIGPFLRSSNILWPISPVFIDDSNDSDLHK